MNISRARCFGQTLLILASTYNLVAAVPARAPVVLHNPLQDKNFFLLSAIERSPAAAALVRSDATLRGIGAAKRAAFSGAVRDCASDVPCYANALRFSADEIAQARAALGALAKNAAMGRMIDDVLRPSGMLQRYDQESNASLLEKAWEDAARKINRAIDVFALGQPLRPAASGATAAPKPAGAGGGAPGQLTLYDVKSPAFAQMVRIMAAIVDSDPKALELFFQPSLRFAIELMLLHVRDEAARHEPLEMGENRAAFARIPSINWNRFPYTVIVVLGNGPDREGVALAPVGRLRLMLAVKEFREGKAPFVLVSGGYVHPNLTPYNEALEMKKALIKEFGIPESAILVDPQARRTTTNLRNAVRLIYRYRIPFDRKGLILTDQLHSASIETAAFKERCVRDFGYEPVQLGARISPFDLEFIPLVDCLHVDAVDMLDP